MKVLITGWALDSYLNLRRGHVFTDYEYNKVIRPDVMLLKLHPQHPKFEQGKFWSVAQDIAGKTITNGFKMKWHQIGPGLVQLRVTVGIIDNSSFLCEAYVKQNEKQDKRQLARFKTILQLIRENRYTIRGELK